MTSRLEGYQKSSAVESTKAVPKSAQSIIRQQERRIKELEAQVKQLTTTLGARTAEGVEQLNDAQALTHLGSWQWDIASDTVSWSDEQYRLYGLKPGECEVNLDEFLKRVLDDDREKVKNAIYHSFQTGEPFEFEHRVVWQNKKVRTLFAMGKVVKDKAGKPIKMMGTGQDITDRKEVEFALQKSDQRFRSVTQATHDLVFDIDLVNSSIWFNESLQSEYGYPRSAMNKSLTWWTNRIHRDDRERVRTQIQDFLASNHQSWHTEHRFRKADGAYAIVRNRAFVLRDSNGKPERIIGSFLDITEAKRLDRAKDEFITLVSHQLRTPLTIIRLYGNMLSDGIAGKLSDGQQEYVGKITNASVRLIKLVGDILNISRLELNRIKIESSPTDPNLLVQLCIDELAPVATSKHAQISFEASKDIGLVPIDATVFSEITHNLVGNALRYLHDTGGHIKISLKKERRGYLLSVADNGIGIPRAAQTHIFERFYRAKNAVNADGEGTGLGLYLVKLFTDTAGGKIWFESREGKGTTFFVLFPPEGMQGQAIKDTK